MRPLYLGIGMMAALNVLLGIVVVVIGAGLIVNYFSKKTQLERARLNVQKEFDEKRNIGFQVLRAALAETVDFRREFAEKDAESQKVLDFLEQISPEQYVKKLADGNRRIKMKGAV